MKLGRFEIVKSKVIRRFALLPRRLTLKSNPPIYYWGWWAFGLKETEAPK